MTSEQSKQKTRQNYRNQTFLNRVGARMQQLMDKRGITHEIFYNDTSINPHRIIVGKMNMTISTFSRICEYLKVSPEEFFKGIR
jgi:DNA-binding Xre family transcriptional regulator